MCASYSLANRKSRANAQNTVLLKSQISNSTNRPDDRSSGPKGGSGVSSTAWAAIGVQKLLWMAISLADVFRFP
ncbi:hypothetical protein T07_5333 [Trichinella nelsoni]|uniref:Uncharacterized protein n=1 Tax=Trichinella nelsoni TaxID=6336 RepID=A0A0V0RN82_9BILA|nr:hypothetical protein T07_5333 [Trichinella nelsoni]